MVVVFVAVEWRVVIPPPPPPGVETEYGGGGGGGLNVYPGNEGVEIEDGV